MFQQEIDFEIWTNMKLGSTVDFADCVVKGTESHMDWWYNNEESYLHWKTLDDLTNTVNVGMLAYIGYYC